MSEIDLRKLSSDQIRELMMDELDALKEEISYLNAPESDMSRLLQLAENIENMMVRV